MKAIRFGALLVMAACSGGEDKDTATTTDTDTTTTDTTTDTDTTAGYPATWAGVESFFADNCDQCHGVTTFDLHDAVGAGQYIVPGDSASSELWNQISTGTMPPGGGLTMDDYGHVQEWIDAGAMM